MQHEKTTAPTPAGARPSPREIGRKKLLRALVWVYVWGWSSASILSMVACDNGNGLTARAARLGFLKKTRTESGGGRKDVPAHVVTLTAAGVAEVERTLHSEDELLPYPFDAYKINQALLRHDTLAQLYTARMLLAGSISGYVTERQMRGKSTNGTKQPDVVWVGAQGKWAVEIELSAKWKRDLDHFVGACIDALTPGDDGSPARFDLLCVLSDAPAILQRYKKAFSPGAPLGVWQRDAQRHWFKTGERAVPEWVSGKVVWKNIN